MDGVLNNWMYCLQIITTNNYNTIADFHTLQFTTAHAKSFPAFSVFTRRFLVTASNNGYSSAFVLKPSLNGGSLPTDSRLFHTDLPVFYSPTDWALTLSLAYISARTTQKTPFLSSMRIRCSGDVVTEPFPSSGRLFLFIKNLLPSNGCRSVVCFTAAV
jgi:hypothetical protein